MPRALWKATLHLQLVVCPVKLYSALAPASEKVRFNLLNPRTHNRVKLVPHNPETGESVDKADLLRAYELEKGRYVTVEKEEIEALRMISEHVIELEQFVKRDEVDPVFLNHPYYLRRDGEESVESYAVIRDAMRQRGKVGVGRMVFRGRDHVILVEPLHGGIVLTTLRTPDEVQSDAAFFADIGDSELDPELVNLAVLIIEKKKGHFDPERVVHRYQERLRELIEAKLKGKEFKFKKPREPAKVIDLKEVLRRAAQAEGGAP